MTRPVILGLTGSIGMGKSTVAQMFSEAGVPVFDADAEVHKLQGPGGPLLPAIEAAFPGTTGPQGVDRPALGNLVFGPGSEAWAGSIGSWAGALVGSYAGGKTGAVVGRKLTSPETPTAE